MRPTETYFMLDLISELKTLMGRRSNKSIKKHNRRCLLCVHALSLSGLQLGNEWVATRSESSSVY